MSPFRFLPGLILVQLATAVLAIVAISGDGQVNWLLAAVAALLVSVVVGFWFASIADHARKDLLANERERFAQERERLVVAAETEKRNFLEDSHRKIVQETSRAHAKANFKLGAAMAGMVAVAGVLLYVEMITLAVVTLTTAGGGLAGYLLRIRQERRALQRPAAERVLADVEYRQLEPPSGPPAIAARADRKSKIR